MHSLFSAVTRPESASHTNLRHEIDAFLTDRQARQLSPRTVAWYQEKLARFAVSASRDGLTSLLDLTPDQVRQYLLELRQTHNAGGCHGLFRALRALVNWFGYEYEPEGWRNPLDRVRAPKVPQRLIEPVPLADVAAILEVCPTTTELGCRDRAILLALLDTGCRASEFLDLCLGDVDPFTGACQVRRGKGDKSRSVFLGETAREALRGYLDLRQAHDPLAPLWATRGGTRLSYSGLREIVRRRARKAQVPAPSIHGFRRAFALGCLRRGMDIFSLQRLMGHADISILRRYLAQTHDDLLVAHRRHGPVDGLLGLVASEGGEHGAG